MEAAKGVNTNESMSARKSEKYKLPKIELPEFHGDICQWPMFFAKFNDIFHNNPSLDDNAKLHYLLGALKGRAQEVCVGFTPTPANYTVLLETLKAQYDNKRALADTYWDQILELKPLFQESVSALTQILLKFDTAYRSLWALKLRNLPNVVDYLVAALLLRKMDPYTHRIFETSKPSEIPSYAEVHDFLQNQIKI